MNKKENLVLFGKEIASRNFLRYRLYFTEESTMDLENPSVSRMVCLHKKQFYNSGLGKVYQIKSRGKLLDTMSEAADIEIPEANFQKLLKKRSIQFNRAVPVSPFIHQKTASSYYTFKEAKALFAYRPEQAKALSFSSLKTLLHLISFLLPFLLFVQSLYSYCIYFLPARFFGYPYFLLPPAFYFISIPLVIYLMKLLYTLSDAFLLRNLAYKNILYQQEAYKNGGLRKVPGISEKQKSRLIKYGIIFGGSYILFWIIMILL